MSVTTDLAFITNEQGNRLNDRFKVLLERSTHLFDCLVGYFYISGFHKIYPHLENVEKVRILIGLQTDWAAFNLMQQAKKQNIDSLKSHAETQDQISKDVLKELEASDDAQEIEDGVKTFVSWIRSGKLEIRAYPSNNLHAKVYIITFNKDDRDVGRVITGSSNLTQSGLQDNLEFNVELKNRADYEFALAKFNELWEKSVDVKAPYEDIVINRSPFAQFTPYELYLKFLYEYFNTELNRPDVLDDLYVPADFKRLKYQEEAVLSAKKILEEYGGLFLSDVVGLGKTYMAALLAQQLDGRSLVIAPPHLLDENNRGSWKNVFSDFKAHADFVSIGKIEDLLSRDLNKYINVFIDESHRFRTETNQTYELLARICRGKKIILVSATPLNNTPRDILSQIKLFQNGKNSTIPNVRNLEAFFTNMEKKLKGLDRQDDRERYFKIIKENANATREKVLKFLMIRRTRNEITKYYGDDLNLQGMKFPEVKDPKPLFYKLNQDENQMFYQTIDRLTHQFNYARYKPLEYYDGEREKQELQGQRNLARFMKILMVKRLESSFHAFRLTIKRFIHTYERFIEEFHNGNVYISKKHTNKIFELLEFDDHEAVERLLDADKAERLPAKDFLDNFIHHLESDLAILHQIQDEWKKIKRDPKWLAFQNELKQDPILKNNRLIVFTESKETAEYLKEKIAAEIDTGVLLYTGDSDENVRKEVISNFDARAYTPKDDYRILIATEVLSEGVNLHRSNTVINYDIPWNPTRLIQRVGRVNRVDTKFDSIYAYNFFPTEESNDLIKLKEAAEAKIQAFIEMLGADARLLTENEEITSHDLFAKLNAKETITGENDEEESELEYLNEIRDVRDHNINLFTRIKQLPKKARSTRIITNPDDIKLVGFPALLTYFRKGKIDKFFLAQTRMDDALELDFITAAKTLKPNNTTEERQSILKDFYDLLIRNKNGFEAVTQTGNEDETHRSGKNDSYILNRLKAKEIRLYHGYTDEDELYIKQVIELLNDGALPRPTTKKVAAALKKEADPLKVLGIIRRDIPIQFLQPTRAQQSSNLLSPSEVILSSYLVGA